MPHRKTDGSLPFGMSLGRRGSGEQTFYSKVALPNPCPGSLSYDEPQHWPGVQPLLEGDPPQQVEPPPMGPGSVGLTEKEAADMSCSSLELPQLEQVRSSEFLPMPTISSLTCPQSEHLYSCIGIGFPFFATGSHLMPGGSPDGLPSRSFLLLS